MPELLIINPSARPSKRKGVKKMAKRRRTAAQIAATKKLVALNRGKRKPRRKARAANPAPRKYRAVKRRVMSIARPRRRSSRARRRNPIGTFSLGALTALFKEGAIGAGGALTVDLALGYIPLPASMVSRKTADGGTNYVYYLTKASAAMALGAFGKRLIGKNAETMALGAMTVNMYDFFRTIMPAGISLGYMSPGHRASLNAYVNRRAGNATANPQQISNTQTRNVSTLQGNPRMAAYTR